MTGVRYPPCADVGSIPIKAKIVQIWAFCAPIAGKGNAMTDVTITTANHQLRGYLARPAAEGPRPGVIVLHDAAGMTHDLRHQADWLPGADYLAVASDLFSWGRKMACLSRSYGS
jgi:hypothetical protein